MKYCWLALFDSHDGSALLADVPEVAFDVWIAHMAQELHILFDLVLMLPASLAALEVDDDCLLPIRDNAVGTDWAHLAIALVNDDIVLPDELPLAVKPSGSLRIVPALMDDPGHFLTLCEAGKGSLYPKAFDDGLGVRLDVNFRIERMEQ